MHWHQLSGAGGDGRAVAGDAGGTAPLTFTPSPAQRQAIEAPRGPVLVVAGPGAGKTYCLIARIGRLIAYEGVAPERICAITFTNKAADEIAERLRRDLGPVADGVTRGTLHALCVRLLRHHAVAAGLRRGFGIVDEDYQRRVLRRLGVRPERQGQLLLLFGRHRLQHTPLTGGDLALFEGYAEALRSRNLLDYDDLISRTGTLLRGRGEALADVSSRWDCVLVDEFQDLSLAQYEVVTHLASSRRECFAVGDDEQSIFSWTGADPAILERFRTDFGIAAPIVLDLNRRCSRQIFDTARRLVTCNPGLFEKRLEATRESEHCVAAHVFDDEVAEAAWLLADLTRDRAEAGLDWGAYGVLYRYHRTGQRLETALIDAGIPCLMAKGQALLDDELIAFVVASLRIIRAPDDPLPVEAFAEQVLPRPLLDRIRASHRGLDLLTGLRAFTRSARGDPDTRPVWRFIFHIDNLAGLSRAHESLGDLVDALLSQRLGRYRNPLDERASELTDPADVPGAAHLADRLAEIRDRGATVWVEPDRGVDLALLPMLRAVVGDRAQRLEPGPQPRTGDLVLRSGGARPLLVFKALQLLQCRGLVDPLQDFVAFDVETTEMDVAECEIVELAAVRVRGGVSVERIRWLIRTSRPISPRATAVHGWKDADVCDEPGFAEIWPAFREFVGSDLLVAHNGHTFDVPVLRRLAGGLPGLDDLVFLDTLPLARSLVDGSAKLEDLAHRFGVSAGRSHHAEDDAGALAGIVRHLGELRLARARRVALVQLLGWLGLALALDAPADPSPEERLLRELALPAALGRYGGCLEGYAEQAAGTDAPAVEELIERLGGQRLLERIRTERPVAERYPASAARLAALVEASTATTVAESIDLLLDRVALSRSDGAGTDGHRVSLLTLHATKGLEFGRVYIVGAEDNQLPGARALEDDNQQEIQEARRLLYVGMTRAKDRLVLTRAVRRDGRPAGGSRFLREAGLEPGVLD
ncbi:MAG: UvrD-helicase domain-containing protein [Gemmatimonadota bacterium]|nr:UvrD-helicase domain-containing protein [Gemmatimonadota bacterium]